MVSNGYARWATIVLASSTLMIAAMALGDKISHSYRSAVRTSVDVPLPSIGEQVKIAKFKTSAAEKRIYVFPSCGSCTLNPSDIDELMSITEPEDIVLFVADAPNKYKEQANVYSLLTVNYDLARAEFHAPLRLTIDKDLRIVEVVKL